MALKALLERTQTKLPAPTRSTVASRKAAYQQMLDVCDIDGLAEIEKMAAGLLGRILSNSLDTETGVLSREQAADQMQEALDIQKLSEVFDVRHKQRKAAVFKDITTRLAAEGVADPENTNGHLDVPELGKRFSRENCGYGDPTVDEGRLRVLLGEDLWAEVCDEVEIPAHVELTFSVEKALDLANRDPEAYAKLTECILPGAVKNPRLVLRDIPDKEK